MRLPSIADPSRQLMAMSIQQTSLATAAYAPGTPTVPQPIPQATIPACVCRKDQRRGKQSIVVRANLDHSARISFQGADQRSTTISFTCILALLASGADKCGVQFEVTRQACLFPEVSLTSLMIHHGQVNLFQYHLILSILAFNR